MHFKVVFLISINRLRAGCASIRSMQAAAPSRYWQDVEHGDSCGCLLLARALGAPPSAVDLLYCRFVLQKHWRVTCNHGCGAAPPRVTLALPGLDAHDPVQAVLLANSPR